TGLLAPHGRSTVTAPRSDGEQVVVFWQLARLAAATRSTVEPPGTLRVPAGGPSMSVDRAEPAIGPLQSSTGARRAIARTITASAAYCASTLLRKCAETIVSD